MVVSGKNLGNVVNDGETSFGANERIRVSTKGQDLGVELCYKIRSYAVASYPVPNNGREVFNVLSVHRVEFLLYVAGVSIRATRQEELQESRTADSRRRFSLSEYQSALDAAAKPEFFFFFSLFTVRRCW